MNGKRGICPLLAALVSMAAISIAGYASRLPALIPPASESSTAVSQIGKEYGKPLPPKSEKHQISHNKTLEEPWQDLSATRLGMHLFQPSIDTVRLVGERHSGTTYLTRYLQSCFEDVKVEDVFVRGKHWFQPKPETIVESASRLDHETLFSLTTTSRNDFDRSIWTDIAKHPSPREFFRNTLVVVLVRDPHQWLEAMRLRPWHWPNHLEIKPKNASTITTMKYKPNKLRKRKLQGKVDNSDSHRKGTGGGGVHLQKSFVEYSELDWEDFVQRPMKLLDEDPGWKNTAKFCQKAFPRGAISPCVQNHSYIPPPIQHIPRSFLRNLPLAVNDVIYEQRYNGEPFSHPLELREEKLRNILSLPKYWDVGGMDIVRYEDILGAEDNGTNLASWVQELAGILGAVPTCQEYEVVSKVPYTLNVTFSAWIDRHGDWDLEGLLGYSRYGDKSNTSTRF